MKRQNENMQYGYALITGATGGLGKAFVRVLAQRGYDLLLTGRSEEKLQTLQTELKKEFPNVKTYAYAADLSNETQRSAMQQKIQDENKNVALLVNVAGADVQKGLTAYTQEKIAFQCRINFEAAFSMCRFAIENKAEKLQIINISSV